MLVNVHSSFMREHPESAFTMRGSRFA